MERGRILLLGKTKEQTYEVRNLLDTRKFEIEIALSVDVARTVLAQRYMNLLVVHTEVPESDLVEFFSFVEEQAIDLHLLVFGEETTAVRDKVPEWMEISYFEKPYAADEVYRCIEGLEEKAAQGGVGASPYN